MHIYNASAKTPTATDSESGFTVVGEAMVGIEFLQRKRAKLHLSAAYSAQVTDADLCCIATFSAAPPFNVDLSGFYLTMGASSMFGR